jgi:predicted P-loop ATPase
MNQSIKKSDRLSKGDRSSDVMHLHNSHSKLNHSGKNAPCPICGRTKDRDCSWTDDQGMVLCHTHANDPKPVPGYQFRKLCDSGIHGVDSAAMYVKTNEQKAVRKAMRTEYVYRQDDGSPFVKVVRVDDGKGNKKIHQEHYLNGLWFLGVPVPFRGKVPLYRIYDNPIQQAIKNGEPLLIVEGEGKVDLLMKLGIAATCAIGGAGKWQQYGYPNYLKDLEGAKVVIVPDRDKPGMSHALTIAQDFPEAQWLYPFPESPAWDNLPKTNGVDIADWIIDYRLTKDEVLAAIGPYRKPVTPNLTPDTLPSTQSVTENPPLLIAYETIRATIGDRLRFNTLFKQVELDGEVFDPSMAKLKLALNHRLNLKVAREDVADIVVDLAHSNSYSPIVEYLTRVHAKHGNDISILRGLTERYLCTKEIIHQKMVIRFLIGAVARAFKPGCKNDCALILQGAQGIGKSSFFRVLASEAWFDDSFGSMSDKDERLKIHRTWFIEIAELETMFRRKDISQVKAFLSGAIDQVRPPYGRSVETMKRACVFTGTTNEDEFLADPTGSRRLWVVPVTKRVDTNLLQQERDRIWAAAVALYLAGNRWHLKPHEDVVIEQDKQKYQQRHPWYDAVEDYCDGLTEVAAEEILRHCIGLELKQIGHREKLQMVTILKQLGFKKSGTSYRPDSKRKQVWKRVLPKTTVPTVPKS